eukprot:3860655-Rhodomonas_salina.1
MREPCRVEVTHSSSKFADHSLPGLCCRQAGYGYPLRKLHCYAEAACRLNHTPPLGATCAASCTTPQTC